MLSRLPFNLGDRSGLARRLAGATLSSAVIRILGLALTFLVGVQLARYLGPAGYGVYGTVMAVMALLIVPAQLGLPQLVTREVASALARDEPRAVKGALIAFFAAVIAASAVMAAIGLLGFRWWPGGTDAAILAAALWGVALVPLYAVTNLAASVMRGLERVILSQAFEIAIRPALFAALLFAAMALWGELDAARALALHVLASVLVLAGTLAALAATLPRAVVAARPPIYRGRAWAASAGPMTGTEILRAFDGNAAVLLVGAIVAIDQAGLFRVAAATAAFVGLPHTLVSVIVMPFIARLHAEGDTRRLQALASGAAGLTFLSTAGLTLIVWLFGEALIAAVFGAAFAPAWPALVSICAAYTLTAFFGVGAAILNMAHHEATVTIAYAVGLAIGLPLSALLVWLYGIAGVGVAMLAAELVKAVMIQRRARASLGVDPSALSLARLAIRRAA